MISDWLNFHLIILIYWPSIMPKLCRVACTALLSVVYNAKNLSTYFFFVLYIGIGLMIAFNYPKFTLNVYRQNQKQLKITYFSRPISFEQVLSVISFILRFFFQFFVWWIKKMLNVFSWIEKHNYVIYTCIYFDVFSNCYKC